MKTKHDGIIGKKNTPPELNYKYIKGPYYTNRKAARSANGVVRELPKKRKS